MRILLTTVCLATVVVVFVNRIAGQSPFTEEQPFNIDGFANPPTRTKTVVPSYPSNAHSGTVVLRVKIDSEDRVKAVTVERGVEGATVAAVAAVSQWEYTPTKLNGEQIWVVMTVRVPSPWMEDAAGATESDRTLTPTVRKQ